MRARIPAKSAIASCVNATNPPAPLFNRRGYATNLRCCRRASGFKTGSAKAGARAIRFPSPKRPAIQTRPHQARFPRLRLERGRGPWMPRALRAQRPSMPLPHRTPAGGGVVHRDNMWLPGQFVDVFRAIARRSSGVGRQGAAVEEALTGGVELDVSGAVWAGAAGLLLLTAPGVAAGAGGGATGAAAAGPGAGGGAGSLAVAVGSICQGAAVSGTGGSGGK